MKFVITMVTYFPDDQLMERVEAFLKKGYTFWIFDNTPNGSANLAPIRHYENCVFLNLPQGNVGLGPALNMLFKKVYAAGYSHLMYFDQDTLFGLDSIHWILQWYHESDHHKWAAIQFKSVEDYVKEIPSREVLTTSLLINSGCMFDLKSLELIGWHDSSYFVEGVDYKFCMDAVFLNFKIGQVVGAPSIDYNTMQPLYKVMLCGWSFLFRLYPFERKKEFTRALFRLTCAAAYRRQYKYIYIYIRNIITFWTTQIFYTLLLVFSRNRVISPRIMR